jgi:hypothetical protein
MDMSDKKIKNVEFHTSDDGTAKLILDGRYSPYVLHKFTGAPDMTLMKTYFDFRDRHHEYEQKVNGRAAILIVDITDASAPPSTVRKFAGELASNDVKRGLLTVLVVTNPLLRGVMTAIVWIAGSDNLKLEYANNLNKGVQIARGMFESRGLDPVPEMPLDYDFPKA